MTLAFISPEFLAVFFLVLAVVFGAILRMKIAEEKHRKFYEKSSEVDIEKMHLNLCEKRRSKRSKNIDFPKTEKKVIFRGENGPRLDKKKRRN